MINSTNTPTTKYGALLNKAQINEITFHCFDANTSNSHHVNSLKISEFSRSDQMNKIGAVIEEYGGVMLHYKIDMPIGVN